MMFSTSSAALNQAAEQQKRTIIFSSSSSSNSTSFGRSIAEAEESDPVHYNDIEYNAINTTRQRHTRQSQAPGVTDTVNVHSSSSSSFHNIIHLTQSNYIRTVFTAGMRSIGCEIVSNLDQRRQPATIISLPNLTFTAHRRLQPIIYGRPTRLTCSSPQAKYAHFAVCCRRLLVSSPAGRQPAVSQLSSQLLGQNTERTSDKPQLIVLLGHAVTDTIQLHKET